MVRIILVDDEKQALREMSEELQEQDWEVDAFSEPREALAALQKASYDVGVFDIRMPGISGVELLEQAKGWQSDLDVIFMTAQPSVATAIDAMQLGVLEYLKRPFRLSALVQAINRALTHRSLRLRNAALNQKLEALHRLVDGLQLSQALHDIMKDTLHLVKGAIFQRNVNHQYVSFIIEEGVGSVVESYGISETSIKYIQDHLDVIKHWMNENNKQTSRIFDISDTPEFPLSLDEVESILCAPLTYKERIVGGLLCCATLSGAFSSEDERFFVSTGHLLSHAIERAIDTERFKNRENIGRCYQATAEYVTNVVREVSPHLKNALTAIGGIAKEKFDPLNPVFSDADWEAVYKQACLANAQLDELLGFCYGTGVLELQTHNLGVLLGETVEGIRVRGISDDVTLQVDVPTQPILVACDALQLKRALRNVIENAIQDTEACDAGGQVTVQASIENGSALVRVHNTGESSPQECGEELFNAPMTSPSIAQDTYQRSADGLPVARGILRSHGGDVKVAASEVGQGTTLLITLPLDILQSE